jgi:hypothetical protein
MDAYCSGTDLEQLGINPAPVRALWTEFQAGRSHRTDLLWQMFILVAWARQCRPMAVQAMCGYVS